MCFKDGAEDPACKRTELQRTETEVPSMSVSDLVTKNSRQLLEILLTEDSGSLESPVLEWKDRADYQRGMEIVKHLLVVKDYAEQGVRLFKDFNKTVTKKGE
ncbi:Ribonuclease DdI [Frankliniella fusca]|uniref:Ribonuclease DdI n=1 Tax=Frankliniella fusca TaxID=407009 RepID=A0AAE1LMH4_9NEOP|nr:Ribonuclease DdI [Frankliniella fusca]